MSIFYVHFFKVQLRFVFMYSVVRCCWIWLWGFYNYRYVCMWMLPPLWL